MTDLQFLQLLKREIADFYFKDNTGRCKSTLSALELIEMFRKDVEATALRNYQNRLALNYESNHKNGSGNAVSAPQNNTGSMPDDSQRKSQKSRKINADRTV